MVSCTRCGDMWAGTAGYHVCSDSKVAAMAPVTTEQVVDAFARAFAREPAKPKGTGSQGFVKHDKNKEVYSLIPEGFEEAIAKVLTYGASNPPGRTDNNWQQCKTPWRTYYSALRRHLAAAERGDKVDSDSGESHLAHAACCLAFLFWFEREGKLSPASAASEDQREPGPEGAGT